MKRADEPADEPANEPADEPADDIEEPRRRRSRATSHGNAAAVPAAITPRSERLQGGPGGAPVVSAESYAAEVRSGLRRADDLSRPSDSELEGLVILVAARLGSTRLIDNIDV